MRRRVLLGAGAALAAYPTFGIAKNHGRVIGLSLPLTGNQAEVAVDLQRGYDLALRATGSDLQLLVLDDAGDSARTATNVAALAANSNVIALSGIVGTPHAEKALPIAVSAGVPVVGIRSGENGLRRGQTGVYHLRSSYQEELEAVAKLCQGIGVKKVAVIHSDDAFGNPARSHFVAALKARGIEAHAPIPVNRENPNVAAAAAVCAAAVKDSSTLCPVVLLMISKPMSLMAKELREVHSLVVPTFAMSFVATRSVSADVIPYLEGLGIVSAFPLPRVSMQPIAAEFRKHAPPDLASSLTAFEGFFYGCVIAKTGAQSREQINQKLLAGIQVFEQPISFSADMVGYKHLAFVSKSRYGQLRL
jgi:branched-chain amino acid transport system substrate-binding protein